jgi:hypothetical protein
MILLVVFAPFFHGQTGRLDELELCLTPIVIVITLLVYKIVSRRMARHADRALRHQRRRRAGKDG